MELLVKTLKSLTRRERILSVLLLLVFCFSLYQIGQRGAGLIGEGGSTRVYSEGVIGEIKRINPVFTEFNDVDADISSLVFSGLLRYNPETQDFEEDIATYVVSEDQLTYTFTLKNNAAWHDGVPVTAEDIFYTFAEVIQSPDFDNSLLKSNFDGVLVELLDSRTVAFTLSSPNSFFLSSLTVGILPKHLLSETPVADLDTIDFNKQPIGSGPYLVSEQYSFNQDGSMSVTLTANPNFYGEQAKLKNLRFVAFPSIEDLVKNRSVWTGAARIRTSMLSEFNLDELVPYEYTLPQYTALFMNTDSPFLEKNKTRLGISKAINKAEILEANGFTQQIDTPLLELNQEEWIHTGNLEESRGALFDAGWVENEEGVRVNDADQALELRLVRRDFSGVNEPQEESSQITVSLITEQLAEVGVTIIEEKYSVEELQSLIQERDYDLLLYGQSLGYNLDTFSFWHSSQANENGLNLSNYQNPKADFNIEAVRESFDDEEREILLTTLAETISNDVPAVFLYSPSYYYLVDKRVTGVNLEMILRPIDRFANISSWSLSK